jgi:hypothetical protein
VLKKKLKSRDTRDIAPTCAHRRITRTRARTRELHARTYAHTSSRGRTQGTEVDGNLTFLGVHLNVTRPWEPEVRRHVRPCSRHRSAECLQIHPQARPALPRVSPPHPHPCRQSWRGVHGAQAPPADGPLARTPRPRRPACSGPVPRGHVAPAAAGPPATPAYPPRRCRACSRRRRLGGTRAPAATRPDATIRRGAASLARALVTLPLQTEARFAAHDIAVTLPSRCRHVAVTLPSRHPPQMEARFAAGCREGFFQRELLPRRRRRP